MAKMHNLQRTKADVAADKKAQGGKGGDDAPSAYVQPEDDGARMEFQHHHLTKMGLNGDLKSGDAVHFTGHGTVEASESRSSPDGDKHSATIRFHHGGVDHEKGEEGEGKKDLRNELETAHGKSAEKISAAASKIPEKAGK